MTTKPLVTIITPVYKTEAYIERCINSIIAQTYNHWELLLIDDGSPDNSGTICDDWSCKDTRILTYHKKNGGVSSARNYGLNKAQGDWVIFVDSDDWISPDCLEVCVNNVMAHNVDSLQFNMYKVYKGEIIQDSNLSCGPCSLEEYIFKEYGMVVPCAGGGFYNRKLIEKYAIRFDERMKYAEDGVFVETTLFYSNRMMHIANPLYFYYMNEDSAMHRINVDVYLDSMQLQIDFLDKYPIFQNIYRNLVTMNVGTVCTFGLSRKQRRRLRSIWIKYRDLSPYVHISEYHHSRSVEYIFLPLQRYSFTLAWFFTSLFTSLYWMIKKK